MTKKLLVICGPTSTGKTSLAIKIAKKLNGEIVSADSRQVYKIMNIGTGKDLPVNSKLIINNSKLGGYYEAEGIKIWGYDLVDPKGEFSVAQYLKIAHRIIDDISKRGAFPILVGGTGLYIRGVIDGIDTADVPKNNKLRKNLEGKSVNELYEKLSQLDSLKAGSFNSSDKKNPRRLVRAIEIAQYQLTKKFVTSARHTIGNNFDVLRIGLTAPKEFIDRRIVKRVIDRLDKGIKTEVENLLKSGVTWENQAMMAMGYGLWRDYFEGDVTEDQILAEWARDEVRYAKRQMVWFKKDRRITWFDITDPEFLINVESLVKKWYNQA
ncbi:MAG: tRNA delta(2)-isopentenylpyrophosphate transferase, tRNA dimethylallyltransferase [Microgenomates group bacterium GW2011_GWC1_39_7b]|uniref:tRNA dimethylallyltransferase n=3 Tax=Candidatus Woeseibacteriota TaxID=1752722 RepID=A0A0G0LVH9_9BACT|nr:MAG: tRNA dimethylallyltransferase [Candidatus Woesebacteria bacterium GW2011_GWB1_39_10]KKR26982.1 MAG: tRNA delta(2)-isopentenylpyrophosphate transferase, tRNA dimethylallyltransferase [Microgenomates group bacterium GW2011_GWC1_39_7b]KKR74014.1 MAG: tRNA dimethylallyltransferase [Candidatus Woesebacteria bacterium GW2011_GWA2_40_7]KKS90975.1 MAG: tRNA dimethylallyltransferase [Candidatus Woesebacteria bacterium GW2011_GWA1_43_12]